MTARLGPSALLVLALAGLAACTPTVKVEAPDKPIVINLNVKIEQEVRVKVERDVDKLLTDRRELF
jgi:type IV pilus biogenesis protein CpaD/CtpE